MLNAEKYRAEILGKDCKFGLSNRICKCCYEECATCVFSLENNPNDGLSNACIIRKVKWLLSEYKEPIKLTRFEYEILGHLFKNKQYKFIARERNGYLCACINKPRKYDKDWQSLTCMRSMSLFDDLFQFIQWEDEEPTSIKDVLGNCEVVDDDL